MNGDDPFERRLRAQPLRPVPPAWREEILTAARAGETNRSKQREQRLLFSCSTAWLRSLLWPYPRAWAGLAALWLAVAGFNLASREPARQEAAGTAARPSPQMRELLRQQEQLLVELVGPMERTEAVRPKPAPSQPHSWRHDGRTNA